MMLKLVILAMGAALASLAALSFTIAQAGRHPTLPKFDDEQVAEAPQKFSLDDHKAAIDHFHIATEVLKERCREMAGTPDACLAKGEVTLLERVRKACEEAKGSAELCGGIADAKRY